MAAKPKAKYFCENCGSEVAANARFCPKCGKFFSSVRCPECGFTGDVKTFINGCPQCGYAMPNGVMKASSTHEDNTRNLKRKEKNKLKNAFNSINQKDDSNKGHSSTSEDTPGWVFVAAFIALVVITIVIMKLSKGNL